MTDQHNRNIHSKKHTTQSLYENGQWRTGENRGCRRICSTHDAILCSISDNIIEKLDIQATKNLPTYGPSIYGIPQTTSEGLCVNCHCKTMVNQNDDQSKPTNTLSSMQWWCKKHPRPVNNRISSNSTELDSPKSLQHNYSVGVVVAAEEHHLLPFFDIPVLKQRICRATISHGDFIFTVNGRIVLLVERKTKHDLLSSVRSGHFQRQRHRMMELTKNKTLNIKPHQIVLLVEDCVDKSKTINVEDEKCIHTVIHNLEIVEGFRVFQTSSLVGTFLYIIRRMYALGEHGPPIPLHTSVRTNDDGLGLGSNDIGRVHDVLPPVATPSPFRLAKTGFIPPGHMLTTLIGTARHSSFYRGLGVRAKHSSVCDLIHTLDEFRTVQEKINYLTNISYRSETAIRKSRKSTGNIDERTDSTCRKRLHGEAFKNTTLGKRTATSIIASLGYEENT